MIVFTWNVSPCCTLCYTVAQCLQHPFHSLHITESSQCPRVDKHHPTSVAGTLPAVTRCARKDVGHRVRPERRTIIVIIIVITVLRIVVGFQRRNKCTIKGLGSSIIYQLHQMLRIGEEPEHTRQILARQRRLHCLCLVAES
jgi:hypothetical protein